MKITCLLVAFAAATSLRGRKLDVSTTRITVGELRTPPPVSPANSTTTTPTLAVARYRQGVLHACVTENSTKATAYEEYITATCGPAEQKCFNGLDLPPSSWAFQKSALCLPEGACMLYQLCLEGALKRTGCASDEQLSRSAGNLKAQCPAWVELLGPFGPLGPASDGERKRSFRAGDGDADRKLQSGNLLIFVNFRNGV
jgi:hypothetical protein